MDEKLKMLLELKEELKEAKKIFNNCKTQEDYYNLKLEAVSSRQVILYYLCIEMLGEEADIADIYKEAVNKLKSIEELNKWRYNEFKYEANLLITRLKALGSSPKGIVAMDEKINLLNKYFPETPIGLNTSSEGVNEKFFAIYGK